ncbi:cyclic nucleotide-binding protein [Lewinellaceae bacterium SD302]|nr:cyclic nucleotide-binding protein [Lewinellaceae bacterium SD302]
MKEIENYIQTYFGIGGKDLSPIAGFFESESLKRDDFLLRTGQYARSMSFVRSGCLRMFALDKRGDKEITQWISTTGMFTTDLSSFVFAAPARWNIQALTDCELYTISADNYQKIGELVDNWAELDRLFIARCFITLENRVFGQLSMSAEEKVMELLEVNPEIFNKVQLQYIASMLGMSPETLSRVRRKLAS